MSLCLPALPCQASIPWGTQRPLLPQPDVVGSFPTRDRLGARLCPH